MDGLDTKAAAGGFQHLREEAPGAIASLRAAILVQRLQILEQFAFLHLDPGGEAIMDAVSHFRRASFGEGEAEDIFGPHAL